MLLTYLSEMRKFNSNENVSTYFKINTNMFKAKLNVFEIKAFPYHILINFIAYMSFLIYKK